MQMHTAVLSLYIFFNFVLGDIEPNNTQRIKKTLTLFEFLNENYQGKALKIPAFLIAPIIIVPKIKPENNAKLYPAHSTQDDQEISATFQRITPARVMLNDPKLIEDGDIEVNFRQALNRGNVVKTEITVNKTIETPKNRNNTINKNTKRNNTKESGLTTTEVTTTIENNVQGNITEELTSTSTETSGIYPTAAYNDQTVDTLTITKVPPDYFLLPPLLDEDWKNFTVATNINTIKENSTVPFTNSDNATLSLSVNESDSTIKGPYPAALYHNAMIDQLSITTNSYTNESPLPPPLDDRWRSFSSLGESVPMPNEFRPLAGLYYDGFLHRPLSKNPGFVPYNQYFVY